MPPEEQNNLNYVAPQNIPQNEPDKPQSFPQNPIPSNFQNQNQVPPSVSPQIPNGFEPPSKKNHSFNKIIFTFIALVILAGAGIASAYFYNTYFKEDPKTVLKKMILAQTNVKTLKFDVTTDINALNNLATSTEKADTKVEVSGSVDASDHSKPALDLTLSLSGSFENHLGKINGILNIGQVLIDRNFYANLKDFNISAEVNDLSTQMILDMANSFASTFKNKWIKIPLNSATGGIINQFNQSNLKISTNTTDLVGKIDNTDTEIVKEELSDFSYLNTKELPDEIVNGVKMWHYQIKIDSQKFKKKLEDIDNKRVDKGLITKQDADFLRSKMEESLDPLIQSIKVFDVWIGKKDYYLYRVTVGADYYEPKTKTQFNTTSTFNLEDHNKPINISEPEQSIPIEEFLKQIFGPVTSKPKTKK